MFEKPNDTRALNLMNSCATALLEEYPDIIFSYGFDDEYRYSIFIFALPTRTLLYIKLTLSYGTFNSFSQLLLAVLSLRRHPSSTKGVPGKFTLYYLCCNKRKFPMLLNII